MVLIRSIDVSPSMVNCSCAWASDYQQLNDLYQSPYTGAVTTRTATLDGFKEDETHTVAFMKDSLSSLNSYGYSPLPLHQYLEWIREFLGDGRSVKPFIISITESSAEKLSEMLVTIQQFRTSNSAWRSRIAVEFNSSCPNIKGHSPPSYHLPFLKPFLDVLAKAFHDDSTLTIGLKLPPYIIATQFRDVIECISSYTHTNSGIRTNPFAYFTCTNTLGNSLVFGDQARAPDANADMSESDFAVPPGLGGLAGEAIHALSLGNVYTFSRLLAESDDPAMREIVIIGAGGVTSPEAVERMNRAGAKIVGCATLLGREGVKAFEILSGNAQ
ncbi:FMN-linked oxidoreductase [Rhizopogon vinicolor AM-OR11-026]|uniref:Dihydroorotate oxidase n=1 Tax=Rhizopogon vinicolor AM-OR11-026 TaxID=1314800 RepID=A0A1B7NFK9_9AGAM|nr:FMN-linked oxidoreductase [Rhizopogon vinicolor AM-OR11-026]